MTKEELFDASDFGQLPKTLGLFPLEDTLLLPHGRLPLRVFEPRYLSLIQDTLKTEHKLIGIIQPSAPSLSGGPLLHSVGGAGRIKAVAAGKDDNLLVFLEGHCRFVVSKELKGKNGYRRVKPDWTPYGDDLTPPDEQAQLIDRDVLKNSLQDYLSVRGMEANWDLIGKVPDIELLTSLAMMCPFSTQEKQSLLEAGNGKAMASRLMAILKSAGVNDASVH